MEKDKGLSIEEPIFSLPKETRHESETETNDAQNAFLARFELVGKGWEDTEKFVAGLRGVKPEDIMRVARTYMKHYHFGMLGDPSKIDETLFTFF